MLRMYEQSTICDYLNNQEARSLLPLILADEYYNVKHFSIISCCKIAAQEYCEIKISVFYFPFRHVRFYWIIGIVNIIEIFSVHYTSIYTPFSFEMCVILFDATRLSGITTSVRPSEAERRCRAELESEKRL